MAIVGTAVTLRDLQLTTENGEIADIIEALDEENDTSEFMFKSGNLLTGNVTTRRNSLPTVSKRRINEGTTPTKSTNTQVSDTACIAESYSEIDNEIVRLEGGGDAKSAAGKAFRWSEDLGHVEGMKQTFINDFVYGDEATDDTECTGIAARRAAPSTVRSEAGYYMIDGGGVSASAQNCSAYLIPWGDRTVHCMYPKGTTAGLEREDLGKVTKEDSTGLREVWRSHFMWHYGLVEKDVRAMVRICNIDVPALRAGTGADLIEMMIIAEHVSRGMKKGRAVWYVPEVVSTFLDLQTLTSSNMNVSYKEDPHGSPVMNFRQKPVRTLDALLETEATIAGTFAHG